ncbi:MAG: cytochrome c, partial [Acidobacteriaceae bacterium]
MNGAWRAAVASAFFLFASLLLAQTLRYPQPPNPKNGERIFKNGCVACHGADATGAPQTTAGFARPDTFPDFTKCDQTTPEPDSAWKDVIVNGGPSRGFSQIMPSFGVLLTSQEIDDVIAYLRHFCTNKHWARGELNLPRALITEKAFPEDEEVMSTAVNAQGAPGFVTDIIHEERFGVHNQIEVDVPVNAQDQNHTWYGGVGDTTFGIKREVFSSLRTGS